jgi:multicomponent Na+:H+ antiporter subunit C
MSELLSLESYNYWISVVLMMIGFYAVIAHGNLVKKIMGLAIFQVSVLLLYMSVSFVSGANVPILQEGVASYVNPLPHVLMLTAIVVGVSVMAVGLALAMRIKKAYGTVEEEEILELDRLFNQEEKKRDVTE